MSTKGDRGNKASPSKMKNASKMASPNNRQYSTCTENGLADDRQRGGHGGRRVSDANRELADHRDSAGRGPKNHVKILGDRALGDDSCRQVGLVVVGGCHHQCGLVVVVLNVLAVRCYLCVLCLVCWS